MADASFAMPSHGASSALRNDRPAAKASVAADSARGVARGNFAANFAVQRAESASAAQQSLLDNVIAFPDTSLPTGPGLLSTGVQFLLAETRTQEATAKFPAPSNLERARDAYLDTQARVKETIAANRLLAQAQAPAPSAPDTSGILRASATAAYKESGIFDEDSQ